MAAREGRVALVHGGRGKAARGRLVGEGDGYSSVNLNPCCPPKR